MPLILLLTVAMENPPAITELLDYTIIERAELQKRLADRALALVNVMPAETFRAGRIPGSVNLPVAEIGAKARQILADFDQEIAVYCAGPT